MAKMATEIQLKKESVIKLEKVLSLWKSKNFAQHMTEAEASNKKSSMKQPIDGRNGVMFFGRKLSRKDIQPNSLEDITITSQRLCEEYIEARLARSGIKGFEERSGELCEEYSNVLQNMGQILEMKYPRLYTKLSVHLKLTYDSEIVVWDSFNKFGTQLFLGGITWAKIIAFYAFTGGLALDCMKHGKNELPGRMVYWFGVFVLKKLAIWIQTEGGWSSIVNHFNGNQPCFNDEDEGENDEDLDTQQAQQCIMDKMKEFTEEHQRRIIIIAVCVFVVMAIINLFT